MGTLAGLARQRWTIRVVIAHRWPSQGRASHGFYCFFYCAAWYAGVRDGTTGVG